MQDRAVVVKLGGSILTDELRGRSFVGENVVRIAKELSPHRDRVIVVTGGGWVAHKLARSLLSNLDLDLLSQLKLELCRLALDTALLLHEARMRPVILDPLSLDRVADYRDRGFTPLVHPGAEMVGKGIKIISGDDIAVAVAKELRAEMVIFITDVDYICRYRGGKLGEPIEELTREIFDGMEFRKRSKLDVTGEMGHKAEMMLELASIGINSCVLNGLKEGRVLNAMEGRVEGTICR
jgi:isopentenyl phosphate kinase